MSRFALTLWRTGLRRARCAAGALRLGDAGPMYGVSARVAAATHRLRRFGRRITLARRVDDRRAALPGRQFEPILLELPTPVTAAADAPQRWRQAGSEPGGSLPVIAPRAAAEPGAVERFRELGVDDHLVKPSRPSRVQAMLMRRLRPQAPAESRPGAAPSSPASGSAERLDAGALARLDELDPSGANGLVVKVLQTFQSSVARLNPQLQAARAAADRPTIKLVAHTLKSSSASIGALRLSRLCAQVEAAVRLETGDLDALLEAFDAALAASLQAIVTVLKERA